MSAIDFIIDSKNFKASVFIFLWIWAKPLDLEGVSVERMPKSMRKFGGVSRIVRGVSPL